MRARLAHVVLVLAGLVAPGLAVAQPPPPPPVIEPASSSANAPRSVWRFGLSAEGAWYDNARFLGPVVEDAAWSTTGRASLSNSVRFRDGTFSISGFIVNFNDTSTGNPTAWRWRFGDGEESTERDPVHQYNAGTFIVRLTVSNAFGSSDASATVTITP